MTINVQTLNKQDKSMAKGGKREGAGRKPVHDEMMAREICKTAIIKKYGSLQAGIEFLLDTNEPTLLKFAFEHAIGKPADTINLPGEFPQINLIMPEGE